MPWDNGVNKTVSIYADCSSSLVEQFPLYEGGRVVRFDVKLSHTQCVFIV